MNMVLYSFRWVMILVVLIEMITGQMHNACEVCTCDNLDVPTQVHCDSKKLTNLTNVVFQSSIETLTFINNSLTLTAVEDLETINNITALKTLILSDNPLSTIPALSSAHLVSLELENTGLKSATFPASYENSSVLQSIVLSKNNLSKIKSDDFKSLPSLTRLVLDDTQLVAIEHDALASVSNTLQTVSLASNTLSSAEFLSAMHNLASINFDHNSFEQLPTEMKQPGRVKHFFFRHNQIETIDDLSPLFHWTKTDISDIEIYLEGNPFDCCQSLWFVYYLAGPHNLVKDSRNLTCASPSAYAGKRLIDLRADLMDCSGGPSHRHLSKWGIAGVSISAIASILVVVIGVIIYRRNPTRFGSRQEQYEPVAGDTLPNPV